MIDVYANALILEFETGVPASIVVAQAALESGYGKHTPTDIYSGKNSFNLFEIKAYNDTSYVSSKTREVVNGKNVYIIAKFAAYDDYYGSLKDHNSLLRNRYQPHVQKNTAQNWADALQQQGYATAPNYSKTIMAVIKYWGLYE